MTADRDPRTRIVLSWLREDAHENAERVLLRALDEVDTTPQRRSRWPAWRSSRMNTYAKLIAAAAAVLVVAVVGYQFLPGDGGIGGQPTLAPSPAASGSPAPSPSPAASASPPAAPSASAAFPAWFTPSELPTGAGILPAGTSTTRSYKPGTSFTVPEGWVNDLDVSNGYGLFPDSKANEAEYASSGEMANGIFIVSVESPYFYCEAWEKTGGTAAERAAFLVASEAFAVSEPVDVTIGDLIGKQVDMRVDPDWTATCPGDPPGSSLADWRNRVTFLDTPGGVIAIAVGSKHAPDHEAFLAEAMPIVESFQFDLNP